MAKKRIKKRTLEVLDEYVVVKFPRCAAKSGRGKAFWRCPAHVVSHGYCLVHYKQDRASDPLTKHTLSLIHI